MHDKGLYRVHQFYKVEMFVVTGKRLQETYGRLKNGRPSTAGRQARGLSAASIILLTGRGGGGYKNFQILKKKLSKTIRPTS